MILQSVAFSIKIVNRWSVTKWDPSEHLWEDRWEEEKRLKFVFSHSAVSSFKSGEDDTIGLLGQRLDPDNVINQQLHVQNKNVLKLIMTVTCLSIPAPQFFLLPNVYVRARVLFWGHQCMHVYGITRKCRWIVGPRTNSTRNALVGNQESVWTSGSICIAH
jgi:hypothetical protein